VFKAGRFEVHDPQSRNSSQAGADRDDPSGDPMPSEADIKVTRDLIRAGQLLKIEVLDVRVDPTQACFFPPSPRAARRLRPLSR
jgi:hypothetical protein